MDFRQLQYFMAAVERRSMSAAARACGVTQPTLSAQIKRLEMQRGEALFARTAAGLEPTARARELYDAFAPVLREAARGWRTGAAPAKAAASAAPNTRQLRYFIQAYEAGGMSRAAAALNVVQPAISMQIRALEKRLGGRLFERTHQGLHPTDLGRRAYAFYAPLLEKLKSERPRRARAERAPKPTLRVGVLPGLDEDSLLVRATTATILDFGRTFSGVELKVVESHSGVLLDWLAEGVIDVAIVEDMHARTALRETVLSREPLAVLTDVAYAMRAPGPIRLNDIGGLNLVLPSKRHGLRALMDRAFLKAGLTLVPRLELDSMASAMRLVKSGGWATVLPPSAVQRSLDDHRLVAHPIIKPQVMRELRAVQLPRRRKQEWEATFIHLLRERLHADVPAARA